MLAPGCDLIDTWRLSDKTPANEERAVPSGHLDHVWVSSDLHRRGCINGYCVSTQTVGGTDHRPVSIVVDITEMLGISNREPDHSRD